MEFCADAGSADQRRVGDEAAVHVGCSEGGSIDELTLSRFARCVVMGTISCASITQTLYRR